MPVEFNLRENGHVIHYVITDPWTIEQVLLLKERNLNHRDQSPHIVHALFNLAGTRSFPAKAITLRHGSPELEHPRSGQVLIVGANELIRSLMELIAILSRSRKMKFFSTEKEAWAYLKNIL